MPEDYWPLTYYGNDHSIQLQPHRAGFGEGKPPSLGALYNKLVYGAKPKQPKLFKESNPHQQRCAVFVNYAKGGTAGKWYSVGKYITRESANDRQVGFSADRNDVDMARTMSSWRRDGDDLFFRVVLSPEFGDRLTLEELTKQTMARIEADYGKLEWMAVEHHNTENPHVHVIIRGIDADGDALRFPRKYIQEGMRQHAEQVCTQILGHRTERDIVEAQQREVLQARFTGLDRKLLTKATQETDSGEWQVEMPQPKGDLSRLTAITETNLRARLRSLEEMRLAYKSGTDQWRLRETLEESLRAMQRTLDRQKMTFRHGVLSSDKALPFRRVNLSELENAEGRVLVHGQEEQGNGIRNYVLLESVTGEVLQIPHSREIGMVRQGGGWQPGSYVSMERTETEPLRFHLKDLGDAEELLRNHDFLQREGERLAPLVPSQFGGWLNRLQAQANTQAKQKQSVGSQRGR